MREWDLIWSMVRLGTRGTLCRSPARFLFEGLYRMFDSPLQRAAALGGQRSGEAAGPSLYETPSS